ncbi:MAG: hypothetical protein LBT23_08030 [Synergistaceae bacterium]|nr:hypothetical protein [Synergistaceae bacterium]
MTEAEAEIRPVFKAPDYLRAAKAAAAWIERVEVRTGQGVYWPELPDENADEGGEAINFYRGSSGKIFFFSQLYAATNEEIFLQRAVEGASYVMANFEKRILLSRLPGLPNSEWAFYSGACGVAFAMMELLKLVKNAEIETFVRRILNKIAVAAVETEFGLVWCGQSCINYDSGTILFLLYASRYLRDENLLELAVRAGEPLLRLGRRVPEGGERFDGFNPEYYGFDKSVHWANFEMGTAGIAYTLLLLYEASGRDDFLRAAKHGAEYVHAVSAVSGDAALVPYRFPDLKNIFYLGYCHGPTGTARLYHELYNVTGERVYEEFRDMLVRGLLRAGAPEIHSDGYWNVYSQCCGTSGMVGLFLGLWAGIGKQEYLDIANRAGRHILGAASVADGLALKWYQAHERVDPSRLRAHTGYIDGAAGIGMALLQIHQANSGVLKTARLPDDPFPASQLF